MTDVVVKLTPFQLQEVEHGMSVDDDDGNPEWGRLEGRTLTITNLDRALWRITSSRDIYRDNSAGGSMWSGGVSYVSGARSLSKLVEKIVAAAGGLDAVRDQVSATTQRYLP